MWHNQPMLDSAKWLKSEMIEVIIKFLNKEDPAVAISARILWLTIILIVIHIRIISLR
jgi:hypothetical protein